METLSHKINEFIGKQIQPHKYIRKEPLPSGKFKYIYQEPETSNFLDFSHNERNILMGAIYDKKYEIWRDPESERDIQRLQNLNLMEFAGVNRFWHNTYSLTPKGREIAKKFTLHMRSEK